MPSTRYWLVAMTILTIISTIVGGNQVQMFGVQSTGQVYQPLGPSGVNIGNQWQH